MRDQKCDRYGPRRQSQSSSNSRVYRNRGIENTALQTIFWSLSRFARNKMSNPPYFSSMALNTSKLRWPELASDFKLNELEIGTPSNAFSENSSVGLPRSPTVSATYSLKLLKIGSKHLPLGSMLQTKHDRSIRQNRYYTKAVCI